ncbi:MAG: polyprenol monophosphomannose synthase [Fidelibacterota bacterium]|jgi:dolichol-phosphate mannosyltransferase
MKILIISPTYNEHANVATLIERIFSIDPNYHLLIVDDSSPDGTGDIVKRLKSSFPNLHLETRKKKNGLGRAYIYGFKWALKRDYDAIVQMDADMSHDPMDIPQMAQYLDDFDMVIGSRYVHGVSVVNWPIRRLIMSYGANLYSRIATGMPLKDATGGYKIWLKKVLEAIDLDNVKSSGYSFQIEMNFRAWIKGFKMKEHPIIFIDRTIGESKMSRSIMFEAVWMVWRLRIWRIFGWNK